jgi:hypothetical protein
MTRTRTAVILATFVAASAGAAGGARGEDCLAGPNAQAPQGSHWYYRVDRAAHRKCWYLGEAKRRRVAATQTNPSRRGVAAPPAEPDAAPDPGFGTRWPEAAPPAAIVAGPRAEPERVVAGATGVPEPMGARPVPTERVRNEPAPPKPPEPARPQAAAPAPAVATDERGGLPAALFGIALLLAALGTILVRARRRMIRVHDDAAMRSVNDGAARRAGRARRGLRDPRAPRPGGLAQAEDAGSPDEQPAVARTGEGGPLMRASERPDIAAATLQPAIDPLPPEAPGSKSPGVETVADVEQSLRRLLDAWERRAA